jgi:hypothetical protein
MEAVRKHKGSGFLAALGCHRAGELDFRGEAVGRRRLHRHRFLRMVIIQIRIGLNVDSQDAVGLGGNGARDRPRYRY